jgi:peptidase E
LFIPIAANDVDAISVLPKCIQDLLNAGVEKDRITVFDLHRPMSFDELKHYDVVYVTGGNPHYPLERINDTGFNQSLTQYIDNGGVYVGVSAGSWIATNNVSNGLGWLHQLYFRCAQGDWYY